MNNLNLVSWCKQEQTSFIKSRSVDHAVPMKLFTSTFSDQSFVFLLKTKSSGKFDHKWPYIMFVLRVISWQILYRAYNKKTSQWPINVFSCIFSISESEDICIVERLFSSSLVAIVSLSSPRKLKVCHFKKGTEICNYSYSNSILAVRLNRQVSKNCFLTDEIFFGNIWNYINAIVLHYDTCMYMNVMTS